MQREWDKIDEQAEREGTAIKKLAGYSPSQPNESVNIGVPLRLFNSFTCSAIERLTPQEYKKYRKSGELKTL